MRLTTGLLSLSIAATAAAQEPPRIAKYIPPSPHPEHVFVFDSAHVLSTETSAALQDSARSLQAETGADIVWVTLPTLGGRAIEEAALYIGRTWRVGSAGNPGDPRRNRGLVILYVPDKTKTAGPNFRIEVGNGLEGTITDSRSRTITAAMRQDLKAKRYDQAYLAGWNVAARLVREDAAATASVAPASAAAPLPPVRRETRSGNALGFVIMGIMVVGFGGLFILLAIAASRKQATAGATARRRRGRGRDQDTSIWMPSPTVDYSGGSSSMDSSSSSSSSSGGDVGGGGGFSGGGSSDTI